MAMPKDSTLEYAAQRLGRDEVERLVKQLKQSGVEDLNFALMQEINARQARMFDPGNVQLPPDKLAALGMQPPGVAVDDGRAAAEIARKQMSGPNPAPSQLGPTPSPPRR